MRNFFVGLFLAAFLPFIVGFGDVLPDKNIEQVTVKKTILFPQGQLFYPPDGEPQGAPYPCHLPPPQPPR